MYTKTVASRRKLFFADLAALLVAAVLCSSAIAVSGDVSSSMELRYSASPGMSAPLAMPEKTSAFGGAASRGSTAEQLPVNDFLLSSDAVQADIDAQTDAALYHAWSTWEDWAEVDDTVLEGWLDTLGMDRTTDSNFPRVNPETLQGTWYNSEDDVKITISGSLCTVTNSEFDEFTVPYVLLNRSVDLECPCLLAMTQPQFPIDKYHGFRLYICRFSNDNQFETENMGTFNRQ